MKGRLVKEALYDNEPEVTIPRMNKLYEINKQISMMDKDSDSEWEKAAKKIKREDPNGLKSKKGLREIGLYEKN